MSKSPNLSAKKKTLNKTAPLQSPVVALPFPHRLLPRLLNIMTIMMSTVIMIAPAVMLTMMMMKMIGDQHNAVVDIGEVVKNLDHYSFLG